MNQRFALTIPYVESAEPDPIEGGETIYFHGRALHVADRILIDGFECEGLVHMGDNLARATAPDIEEDDHPFTITAVRDIAPFNQSTPQAITITGDDMAYRPTQSAQVASVRVGYGITRRSDGGYGEATSATLSADSWGGVAISASAAPAAQFRARIAGLLSAAESGLSAGDEAFATVDSNGKLARVSAIGEPRIGMVNADGSIWLWAGIEWPIATDTATIPDNSSGYTLSATEESRKSFKAGGALTDHRPVTATVPIDAMVVENETTGGKHLVARTSATSHKAYIPPGVAALVKFDENGAKVIGGGTKYDPRHFGAMFDGVTDDLDALDAMLDAMPDSGGIVEWPPGSAWVRDRWVINKPVRIVGSGGYTRTTDYVDWVPGLTGPAGKTLAVIDAFFTPYASGTVVDGLTFRSRTLVHPAYDAETNTGYAAYCIQAYAAGATVRSGDAFVKAAAADPTLCFRATSMTANGGRGPATMPASQPAWSSTLGATVVDSEGTTWTTESVPREHATSTAYVLNQRVYAVNDNRYIFTCTTAGTTAGTRPVELRGGKESQSLTIGGTVTDGTAVWTVSIAASLYVRAPFTHVKHCLFSGSNSGLYVLGQADKDVEDVDHAGNANSCRFEDLTFALCGVGLSLHGDNCNGWKVNGIYGIGLGLTMPTPDLGLASAQQTNPGETATGAGGHLVLDHSLGGGSVRDLYIELSSGYPVLQNATSILTLDSCFSENGWAYLIGGMAKINGGGIIPSTESIASARVIWINTAGGCGINEKSSAGGATAQLYLSSSAGSYPILESFVASIDSFTHRWELAPRLAGVWSRTWASSPSFETQSFGTNQALDGPVHAFARGFGLGRNTTTGRIAQYLFPDQGMYDDVYMRDGARTLGDEQWIVDLTGGKTRRTVIADGYSGPAWTAATPKSAGVARPSTGAFPGDIVRPTDASNRNRFLCTVGGATHATTEPTWTDAPNVNDTLSDNTVTWKNIGKAAEFNDVEYIAIPITTSNNSTTTAASLALTSFAKSFVKAEVVAWQPAGPDCAYFERRASWYRAGTAAPTSKLADGAIIDDPNAAGTPWTAILDVSGNNVRVRVTGDTGKTIRWTVRLTIRESTL